MFPLRLWVESFFTFSASDGGQQSLPSTKQKKVFANYVSIKDYYWNTKSTHKHQLYFCSLTIPTTQQKKGNQIFKCTNFGTFQTFLQRRYTNGHKHMKRYLTPFVIQFSSLTQSCLTLCDPMNHSMPGLPVHHQLLVYPNALSPLSR